MEELLPIVVGVVVEQATDYYPFERSFEHVNVAQNRYLYNGKELQDQAIGGTPFGWYDYGARFYDPEIGRWHTPDPLAEAAQDWSTYRAFYCNPIKFSDPTGMLESTHTDEDGNVVAVYDDGDLGVYKHTQEEVKKAKGSGKKLDRDLDEHVGYTLDIESFKVGDKINFGSYQARDWLSAFEGLINQGNVALWNPKINMAWYGVNARNGGSYDPKSYLTTGSQISEGVYVSPRDLGNYAAGAAARITGMSKMDMMLFFGAFQQSKNGLSNFVLNLNANLLKAKEAGFPTFGEGRISNRFQRLGYEGIKTIDSFNRNYKRIWEN